MPRRDEICRVLIVDDELDYAARVAAGIETAFRDGRLGSSVRLELSNTAAFAAAELERRDAGDPPWDVILADVVMPRPARRPSDAIIVTAKRTERSHANQRWTSWEYPYTYNSHAPDVEHGGLFIAHRMADLRAKGKALGATKLVLISSRLVGTDRRRLHDFQAHHRDWFVYYDKTPWGGYEVLERSLPEGVFQWAVVQAIRERKQPFWGDSALDLIPDANDLVHSSPDMAQALLEARVRAADSTMESILLTGEPGVGRRAVAHFVHTIRSGLRGNSDAPFVMLDAWTVPADRVEEDLYGGPPGAAWGPNGKEGIVDVAADGTLFIHEVSKLPPYVQAGLLRLLEERCFRRPGRQNDIPFRGMLTVLSAEDDLEDMVEQGLLDRRLRDRLRPARVRIPPLRQRHEDVIPLARRALELSGAPKSMTTDAEEWLLAREYHGNVRELCQLVRAAALANPGGLLSADHLESLVDQQRSRAPEAPTPAETGPDLGPTNQLVRETADLWCLRFHGRVRVHISDRVGIDTVARLLEQPGSWFPLGDLEAGESRFRGPSAAPSRTVLEEAGVFTNENRKRRSGNARDLRELRAELAYLNKERDSAEHENDPPRAAKAREAMELIFEELKGRDLSTTHALSRKETKTTRDRIRRRIKLACDHFNNALPGVGSHIYHAIQSQGDKLAYRPDDAITWHVVRELKSRRP